MPGGMPVPYLCTAFCSLGLLFRFDMVIQDRLAGTPVNYDDDDDYYY